MNLLHAIADQKAPHGKSPSEGFGLILLTVVLVVVVLWVTMRRPRNGPA